MSVFSGPRLCSLVLRTSPLSLPQFCSSSAGLALLPTSVAATDPRGLGGGLCWPELLGQELLDYSEAECRRGDHCTSKPSSGVSLPARKRCEQFARESDLSTGYSNHKGWGNLKNMYNVQHFSPVKVRKPNHGILFKAERSFPFALHCCHVKSLRGRMKKNPGEGSPVKWSVFFSILKYDVTVVLGCLRMSDSVRTSLEARWKAGCFPASLCRCKRLRLSVLSLEPYLVSNRWFSLFIFINLTSFYRETSWVSHTMGNDPHVTTLHHWPQGTCVRHRVCPQRPGGKKCICATLK